MYRKISVVIFAICCLFFQTLHCENSYVANNQLIRYMGRIDFDSENNALLSWSGSSIIIKFKGTDISAVLSGLNSKVAFYIDGVKQAQLYTIKANNDTVLVAQNLSNVEHELIIRQATRVNYAQIHFHCIITDGQLLAQPLANKIRLEYFGNSVSEGCAAATPDGVARDNNAYDDNTSAYTCLLADLLGADYNNTSISGIAVCEGAGGVTLGMETRFDKQFPLNSDKLWNFSKYKPDLCIMALGVNEYYNSGNIPWDVWRTRYKAIVYRLRQEYGLNTPFLFAVAPMVSSRSEPVMNAKQIVAELNAEGIKAYFYAYSFLSYNGHPIASEHQKMATELYNYIQTNQILQNINSDVLQTQQSRAQMRFDKTNHKLVFNGFDIVIDSVNIYSISGILLKSKTINNSIGEIDTSFLQNGIYTVCLNTKIKVESNKIIITN